MDIYLSETQGFCTGVTRAIKLVEQAVKTYKAPVYVYHSIVHNTLVVKRFESDGVCFVESLKDAPKGATVIFSAHGVGPDIYKEAEDRGLVIIDATCPLVAKVHSKALNYSKNGVQVVLIGDKNHQEIIGISGYVNPNLLYIVKTKHDCLNLALDPNQPVTYLTQTTLSLSDTQEIIDILRDKYPNIIVPEKSDICFETQKRQEAVLKIAEICDLIIICGSPNSSNSRHLKKIAAGAGVESYLIDRAEELDSLWLTKKKAVGISSGASVPSEIVEAVVSKIQSLYPDARLVNPGGVS
ncbi:4-hydroxy-3-methylbut-2-enyl diphosphate reductase [Thermoproteota archaeon]